MVCPQASTGDTIGIASIIADHGSGTVIFATAKTNCLNTPLPTRPCAYRVATLYILQAQQRAYQVLTTFARL